MRLLLNLSVYPRFGTREKLVVFTIFFRSWLPEAIESDAVDDEYSVIYAETVSMQLERDNITMDSWKWKVDEEYIQDTTVLVANWLYEAD